MSRLGRWMIVLFGALVILGCEQVFSSNLFTGLERDPSNLSLDQQIVYGENALASGDPEKMAKAYDALADSIEGTDDPEHNLLAADLALGASDLQSVYDEVISVALGDSDLSDQTALAAELNGVLGDVDYDYVLEAQAQIDAAEANGGTVSEEQYLLVAVGLMMQAGQTQGGIDALSAPADAPAADAWVNDAITALAAQGESSEYLDQLKGLPFIS